MHRHNIDCIPYYTDQCVNGNIACVSRAEPYLSLQGASVRIGNIYVNTRMLDMNVYAKSFPIVKSHPNPSFLRMRESIRGQAREYCRQRMTLDSCECGNDDEWRLPNSCLGRCHSQLACKMATKLPGMYVHNILFVATCSLPEYSRPSPMRFSPTELWAPFNDANAQGNRV